MFRTRSRSDRSIAAMLTVIGLWIAFGISSVAAWITHVVVCLQDDRWGFLIAGAIAFPVAVVHGWLIWFGLV